MHIETHYSLDSSVAVRLGCNIVHPLRHCMMMLNGRRHKAVDIGNRGVVTDIAADSPKRDKIEALDRRWGSARLHSIRPWIFQQTLTAFCWVFPIDLPLTRDACGYDATLQ